MPPPLDGMGMMRRAKCQVKLENVLEMVLVPLVWALRAFQQNTTKAVVVLWSR